MLSPYTGARYKAAADPDLVAFVEDDSLHTLDYDQTLALYAETFPALTDADFRYLGCVDRFFLFTHILGRHDGYHPWLFERCREVELSPDYHLDLWAREHYKSSLITYAGVIQEILNNPEITIGVFSFNKKIASRFVAQIKREFESNFDLTALYPDICWIKPRTEAPQWSEAAFTVRRQGNPKEATVEGHGLVDGQPTSRHFKLRVYDDVVTRESVTTPDQSRKTTEAWELSDNLKSGEGRFWMPGTRYAFGDTYGEILDRGIVTPRIYPATDNGKPDGNPVFMSPEEWEQRKRTQKSTLAAQMLQNPLSGKEQRFVPEWFRPWYTRPTALNVYILGDPSKGARATSDRTAIAVIGMDWAGNKYLLDGFCHRMTLSQRWDALKHLHKKWTGQTGVGLVKVGWERFGQQTDDEYFAERMRQEKYVFAVHELAWPREGPASKIDRVERLQPDFEYGDFYLPGLIHVSGQGECLWEIDKEQGQIATRKPQGERKDIAAVKARGQGYLAVSAIVRRNEDGELYDLTRMLMDEMLFFPFAAHDDLVDAVSRIYDIEALPASTKEEMPLLEVAADE